MYQPGFQLTECPGPPVLLVKSVPLLWWKTLELQHEARMWGSRMAVEQEQELAGVSGCLHFMLTGCAAFNEITLTLTVPTELAAAVCLHVAAQVPSFRYCLDPRSISPSEQV